MRRVSRLIAISLSLALSAQADDARIYTINESRSQIVQKSLSVADSTARHIIQHRVQPLGSSSLGHIDEQTADLLSAYGAQQSLFATDHDSSRTYSLVILDGVPTGAVIYDEPDLRVSDLSLEALMEDITASVRVTDSSPHKDIKSCTLRSGLDASDESPEKQLDCLSQSPVLNVMPLQQKKELLSHLDALDWVELPRNELSTLIMTFKADHPNVGAFLNSLVEEVTRLASRGRQHFTVVLLPRAEQAVHTNATLKPRSRVSEALLSDLLRSPYGDDVSYKADFAAEQIDMPSALMPICHASNSSCMEATNGCSGHGTCYKKYSTKGEGDCYACKCSTTKVRRKDGSFQTVSWGGPACQKRDISSPFFLIAGVSIVVAAAAMSAVFMLFSIGQQELPSVLGAGVGAPKPK